MPLFIQEQSVFANEYLDIMSLCHDKIVSFPNETKPSYLNLSTMTMVCDLTKHIDILNLSENFKSPAFIECTIKKPKNNKEYDLTKRGKKKKTFFNQASIHFKTHTTKCVKVFSNGRLHITGVTSMIEASDVCEFICQILNNTLGAVVGSGKVEAVDLKICMINTNFAINHGLDIIKLKNIIQNTEHYLCSYTPDTYPGLKIKYSHSKSLNKSSVFVFSSGQIVITGVKLLTDILDVYNSLMNIISENFLDIHNPTITIKKKAKKNEYKFGYELSLIQPCLPVK